MLAILAAVAVSQLKPQLHPAFESILAKKFASDAQKRGWRTVNTNAFNQGGYMLVSEQLTTENRCVRVWVLTLDSAEAARKIIESLQTGSPRMPLDDPALKNLGLEA